MRDIDRDELVQLARRILACDGTEEEMDALQLELERRLPGPGVSDLMFHQEPELTPEEIIERALAYKPIELGPPSSG
jgi:hypothetical protein